MKCQLEKTSQHSTGQNYLPPGGHIPQYTTKQLNSLIYNTAIPLAITKHKNDWYQSIWLQEDRQLLSRAKHVIGQSLFVTIMCLQ